MENYCFKEKKNMEGSDSNNQRKEDLETGKPKEKKKEVKAKTKKTSKSIAVY